MDPPINSHKTLLLIHDKLTLTMTDFILDELQEIHRAMTVTWSVKPEWDSYSGDASLEEHGEWPHLWSSEVDQPPWYPHWGDILAPGFPEISRIDDEEIAYELHTSIRPFVPFQGDPEGDLTAIYNVPLEYEHIWTIRLYIRELEDNGLDGTEDHEEDEDQEDEQGAENQEPMTPEGRQLISDDSDTEYSLSEDSDDEFEVTQEEAMGIVRQLFHGESVIPQQVKDNCREGLRILEEIMEREAVLATAAGGRLPGMRETDFVELCNIFKDVFQMRGSQEVLT
jgi:hypothetical protein